MGSARSKSPTEEPIATAETESYTNAASSATARTSTVVSGGLKSAKRLSPTQAVEFLLRGGTPGGGSHPFYNDYTDLSSLLISQGVVGDRLISAFEQAKRGDVAALIDCSTAALGQQSTFRPADF